MQGHAAPARGPPDDLDRALPAVAPEEAVRHLRRRGGDWDVGQGYGIAGPRGSLGWGE